jgi:hypothetical protein
MLLKILGGHLRPYKKAISIVVGLQLIATIASL